MFHYLIDEEHLKAGKEGEFSSPEGFCVPQIYEIQRHVGDRRNTYAFASLPLSLNDEIVASKISYSPPI